MPKFSTKSDEILLSVTPLSVISQNTPTTIYPPNRQQFAREKTLPIEWAPKKPQRQEKNGVTTRAGLRRRLIMTRGMHAKFEAKRNKK